MTLSDICRTFGRHMTDMKRNKSTPGLKKTEDLYRLEEPLATYGKVRKAAVLKELTYSDFKKVADKVPFTQAEWSDILHISERTLQRYAKDNHTFAPINAERLVLIDNVIQQGKITFGKAENFYLWLKRDPYMLERNLSMHSLSSYEGIQNVLQQLGRIQNGIFA